MIAPTSVENWIKENLFNAVPMAIAVIDKKFNLVYANTAFEKMFGPWKDRKCFSVYKSRDSMCPDCKGAETFKDGASRVNEEVGYNKAGQLTRYIQHTIPVADEEGNISFLVEMAIDITQTEQIKREHRLLFEQVPCNILIIDRDFRILKANEQIRQKMGNIEGRYCFEILKGRESKCSECTAHHTFNDGQIHSGHHVWKSKKGETEHLYVTTVPLRQPDNTFDQVMEMAVDITETMKLEDELRIAHTFMRDMIATSMDGRIALDDSENVTIFNSAARRIFEITEGKRVSRNELAAMLPVGFLDQVAESFGHIYLPETEVKTIEGKNIPVRLIGNKLQVDDRFMGMAFTIQDLREIKQLENDKMEAERLAAVGQTVSGLAHGVKNLITSLEGGMYMLKSGIDKGEIGRVGTGLDMLSRNIDRISLFVKTFLDFAKGRTINPRLCNPTDITEEVVQLYAVKAKQLGVELKNVSSQKIDHAPIDYEGIHECLTNLIGNAIDACCVSDKKESCHVFVKTYEKEGAIIYEVADNGCGMDYEIKNKVFTNFFTTKGLGGTGIGLLMTKKIVYEHGGVIEFESEKNKGTTFQIILRRDRLPKLTNKTEQENPLSDTNGVKH